MNFADMVDEVLINVAGYTQRQDQATYLIVDIDEFATQFTVRDGTVLSRGLVEIDDELMWVDRFDRVAGIAYLAGISGRGFRNSTIAPHTAGARVVVSPAYPRVVVQKAINNAIQGVYPDLYGTFYTTFPFVATRSTYPMPSDAVDVMAVSWQTVGPTKEWLPIRRWRMDTTANPTAFNTGKSLSVYDGIVPGRTVNVVYSKKPNKLSLPSDTFEMTGLPDSSEEVIILGASYRVAAYLDQARVTGMSVEADALDQSNPSGAGAQVSRYLFAQYKDRLAQEVRRQEKIFKVRVHYTR
jgi:hypothetical protein